MGSKDREMLERMRAALRHRGPDDRGDYEDDRATLFHERLSIIDLTSGRQPITNEDCRFWIVFNGEIYNYRELRKDLTARGHHFRTNSDTETILHLYEETGERCVERLTGMFAFALWDARDRTMFLARDRLGIKPLFYTEAEGRFLFASELKALLTCPEVGRKLDLEALDHYLTFMYVPAPQTIVRGVKKLPPGHTLTIRRGQAQAPHCYWELPAADDVRQDSSLPAAAEELYALLQEAVRGRLMSEVPLGAYLSGGLDSSLVVGLMSRASSSPVNTFAVGFEEHGFDERPHAQLVAQAFRTHHTELVARHHALEELPGIIRALDEPVADAAAIPTYFMAQATKEHATVVLTGEGADELFAGYSHYKILSWMDRLSLLSPGGAARMLGRMFGSVAMRRGGEFVSRLRDRAAAYLALKSVFTEEEKCKLYRPESAAARKAGNGPLQLVRKYLGTAGGPYLHQLLRLDLSTWLPDDLLVKVDRMTMAHAVEARVPYLDHRVVESVMRMPPAWKLRFLEGKRILRRAAVGLLPAKTVRRKKTGFAVPVGQWVAADLREFVADILGPDAVARRGLFEPKTVSQLLSRSTYGMFERRQLWTLLCLELWCREFIDN